MELEAKYPEHNFVYDEISRIIENHESLCATLEKNQIACAAIFEAHTHSSILLSFQFLGF